MYEEVCYSNGRYVGCGSNVGLQHMESHVSEGDDESEGVCMRECGIELGGV